MRYETPEESVQEEAERRDRVLRVPVYAFLVGCAGVGLALLSQWIDMPAGEYVGGALVLLALVVSTAGIGYFALWAICQIAGFRRRRAGRLRGGSEHV